MLNKPKDEHYRQAQIYMECLNLDSGFVIYENKNNQQILPIFIERDQPFIDKLFKKQFPKLNISLPINESLDTSKAIFSPKAV